MRGHVNKFVSEILGGSREGEPGLLALIIGALVIVATVAYGFYAVDDTYIAWRIYYCCALAALMGLGVYHLRAPVFHNSIRIMLGEGVLEELVYHVFLLGVAVEVIGLWGLPAGMGFVLTGLVFGLAIVVKSLVWYVINSRAQLRKAAVTLVLVYVVFYIAIVLMPVRSYYLASLFPLNYVELPRPGVDVILGGDEIKLYAAGGVTLRGTVCFYTPDDLAVGFAHSLGDGPQADVATVQLGRGVDVIIVADTEMGVVLRGFPLPENRQTIPLGGTADITIGARAMVYPRGREPYEVTVQYIRRLDGTLHIVLKPDTVSQRINPGDSGSPVVQNGVIIGFANRSPAFNQFYAIAAAELYHELREYLAP